MKRIFFFVVLILVLHNIIGCTKNGSSSGPIIDSITLKPSFYRVDDSTTGIFNYTGIAYDSVQVIDSIFPPIASSYPSGFHSKFNNYSHQVSGQISIKKLTSDSTRIYLSGPYHDNFDKVSGFSGMIFNEGIIFVNSFPGPRGGDTVIKANYLNNILSIQNSYTILLDVTWNNIQFSSGIGKFVNGNWEINYQTSGQYDDWIYSTGHYFLYGYHTYHLICVKQH